MPTPRQYPSFQGNQDWTRAFWRFTEPDLPPVRGMTSPSPFTTAPPIDYTGTPGVDYEHSIPMGPPTQTPSRTPGEPTVETTPGLARWNGNYIAETGMDIYPGQTREQTFVYDPNEQHFSIPHQAVSFTDGPTVETPTFSGVEPSLFGAGDWWRTTNVTGDVGAEAGASPNAGGSIWSDLPIPSGGGRSPSLIDDTGLDWTGTTPEGNPPVNPGNPPSPFPDPNQDWLGNPPETIPPVTPGVPPSVIDDPNLDWTGQTPEPRYTGPGQGNLGRFGGDLSIGEYLNTPLWQMHYGEGYGPVGGGDVIIGSGPGASTSHTPGTPGSAVTGDRVVTSQGSLETGYGPSGVLDYTGPRVNDPNVSWTRDESAPGGWVPQALPYVPPGTVRPGQYYDWTSGIRSLNPGPGTPRNAGDFSGGRNSQSIEGAMLMANVARFDPVNYAGGPPHRYVSDEGNTYQNSVPGFTGGPGQDSGAHLSTNPYDFAQYYAWMNSHGFGGGNNNVGGLPQTLGNNVGGIGGG